MKEHLRILKLRSQVKSMLVDESYRAALQQSIDTYADQIISRPEHAPEKGWDDLEALQQVTLGDTLERALQELASRNGSSKEK